MKQNTWKKYNLKCINNNNFTLYITIIKTKDTCVIGSIYSEKLVCCSSQSNVNESFVLYLFGRVLYTEKMHPGMVHDPGTFSAYPCHPLNLPFPGPHACIPGPPARHNTHIHIYLSEDGKLKHNHNIWLRDVVTDTLQFSISFYSSNLNYNNESDVCKAAETTRIVKALHK